MIKKNINISLLRIFATAMVFFVHLGQRAHFQGLSYSISTYGRYGVHLFFLLSGYLITMSLRGEKYSENLILYYKNRIIRILPLYYIIITYFIISENILNCFVHHIPQDVWHLYWLRYIFLLNGFVNSDCYYWGNLGITWTIPVFCFFYLIAPFVLKNKIRTICFWICSFLVYLVVSFKFTNGSVYYTNTIMNNLHILIFGGLLYYISLWIKKNYFVTIFVFSIGSALLFGFDWEQEAVVLLLSVAILIAIRFPQWKGDVKHEKIRSIVYGLDKYSYTFYLVHGLVFCSILDRLNALFSLPVVIIYIIAFGGSVIGTFIMYNFLEKPLQTVLRKRLE